MSFGARLKKARNSKRMTQHEVAKYLGLNFTTISKYENDKSQPDNDTLQKLSQLYDVSIDWLVLGDAQPSPDKPNGKPMVYLDGEMMHLTEDEARHVRDSLEMFRLLKEKREKYDSGRKPKE
ncbi:helix-turn-helix domain-containing protein [Paenibacillus koleovorans]|uniref:helix-turn-helix domain-containing protein n=1 Tax=Paenibacillus koleovorans TaxID=121608 RepID=UPI000FD89B06|nr:helix-turn-helix transcriptional regulator [Paenibacillus koleovorans]